MEFSQPGVVTVISMTKVLHLLLVTRVSGVAVQDPHISLIVLCVLTELIVFYACWSTLERLN